jgi:hypothetical protein
MPRWWDKRNDILTGRQKPKPRVNTCAWCLRKEREVDILVSGPGVWICDSCVDTLAEIVAERRRPSS